MSAARADCRFLLPLRPGTAVVLEDAEPWRRALERAGVAVGSAPGEPPDLVVAASGSLERALALRPRALVVEGAAPRRALAAAGFGHQALLPAPSLEEPAVLLPLGRAGPVRYALLRWIAARTRAKRARNRVLARLLAAGVAPPGRPLVTVAAREPGAPFLVRSAARELDLPGELDWLLAPGSGDALARGTLHLFAAGAGAPRWVLKFARVPGYAGPFERDERGFAVVEAAGPTLARHAPRLVGRLAVDGLHASLETAATGASLVAFLHSDASAERKHAAVERIAAWLVDVTADTAAPAERLGPELDRLSRDVLPAWAAEGAPADLAARLPPLPAVAQHNDLGTWNVVVDGEDFTAIDWEAARRHGLPLWDLWYLLMDAAAHLDGAATLDERERHFARLFRGELPASEAVFRWTRAAVERAGIPAQAVGSIAALCWMHHGLSPRARSSDLSRFGAGGETPFWLELIERLARRWLADPALGVGWERWRDGPTSVPGPY